MKLIMGKLTLQELSLDKVDLKTVNDFKTVQC